VDIFARLAFIVLGVFIAIVSVWLLTTGFISIAQANYVNPTSDAVRSLITGTLGLIVACIAFSVALQGEA